MITVTIHSTSFDKFKRRIIKYLRYGKNDTQTSIEVGPAGVDSNPIEGMVALYASTPGTGDNYIIGYLQKDKIAAPGEYRIFSTDTDGALKAYAWLKADGKIHLNGNDDNAVRYKPLNQFNTDLKTFLITELGKIATGITGVGGVYTPGSPSSLSVTDCKIDEILTP